MDLNSKLNVSYLIFNSFQVFPKFSVNPNLFLLPVNQHIESLSTSNALMEHSISNLLSHFV
jgi:hypothetical protein